MIRIHTWWQWSAAIVVALASLIIPWLYLPLGEPAMADEGYQALCVMYYQSSPLAMLIFYVGHLWTEMFGTGYLALRELSCFEGYIAIIVGCTYYLARQRNLYRTLWLFSFCNVLAAVERHSMYNWDTGAYVYYALALVAALEYIRRPGMVRAFCLGCALMLVTLARVQLVILIPVFAVFIWGIAVANMSVKVRNEVSFITGVLVTFVILAGLMSGSVIGYLSSYDSDNVITGHGPGDWYRYWYITKDAICGRTLRCTLPVMAVAVALWLCSSRSAGMVRKVTAVIILLVTGVAMGALQTDRGATMYGMESATAVITVLLMLLLPLYNVCNRDNRICTPRYSLFVLWVIFSAPAFGSDYWFARFNAFYLIAPALVVVEPYSDRIPRLKSIIGVSFACLFIAYSAVFVGRYVVASCYSPQPYDDIAECEGIKGDHEVYTEWKSAARLYDVLDSIGARVNFDGQRFGFTYSWQKNTVTNLHRYHFGDNEINVEKRREAAHLYDAWIFVSVNRNDITGITDMLGQEGYRCLPVSNPNVILYVRPQFYEATRVNTKSNS